jgi:hypothetical protein
VFKKLAIVLVAVVALFVAMPGRGPSLTPSPAEAYPGADNFQIVGQDCLNTNNVRLQMAWISYNTGPQWFDVSLQNNGWLWGTFVGAGPIASGQSTFTWEGFVPNARHYLRVNTLTLGGWYESQTVSFVTRNCFGGGGGGGKVGPQCDGLYWCAGDPIPSFCAQQGLYNGCIWVDRIANPFSYGQGQPVAICFWLPGPAFVHIQTQGPSGTNVLRSAGDDGKGDCFHSITGLPGNRLTTLQLNGSPMVTDQVAWRVN